MKLILVRHGETEENARSILQGHLPGKLNAKGKAQAREIAQQLAAYEFRVIYSSDLARTADTARIISAAFPDVPLIFRRDLRERDFGSFNGKPWAEIGSKPFPPDAESIEHFRERARQLIAYLRSRHENDTVLLVSHSFFLRQLWSICLDVPPESFADLKNCEIVALD